MTEQKTNPFSFEKASGQIGEFKKWSEDPVKYEGEGKKVLTKEEYGKLNKSLLEKFSQKVFHSSLSTGKNIGKKDLDLIHELQDSILETEKEFVPDEKRRPWDEGCIEHSRQVEAVARTITEEINKQNPDLHFDVDKISAKAAVHDIGRSASHHAVIHGMAGRELLKNLGFAPEFRTTTLAHLEAGIGPYITDIDQKSWEDIKKDDKSLKERVAKYSPEEVIIALADMAKKGELIDGKFYNKIADPIEGLWPSVKRRMPDATDEQIKGTMYVGFAQALKDHIENKFFVKFSGEEGMIKKSQEFYAQEFGK